MIADAVRAFSEKAAAMSARERAGLAILAAITAITALIYAVDWANSSADTAANTAQAAANSSALQSSFEDEVHQRTLAREVGNIWRWSRSADAFAAEEVLTELESACLQAGFGDPRITLVEQDARPGRVKLIEASISADFDWRAFLALLEAFEASELTLAVRSIDVTEEEGAQRLTLVVAVPMITGNETR